MDGKKGLRRLRDGKDRGEAPNGERSRVGSSTPSPAAPKGEQAGGVRAEGRGTEEPQARAAAAAAGAPTPGTC